MVLVLLARQAMIRRLLSAAALHLLLAPTAQAATINLLLTTEHYDTTIVPPEVGVGFSFFEAAAYSWPRDASGVPAVLVPRTYLATGSSALLPGVAEFSISFDVDSLDDVYFTLNGSYRSGPAPFFPYDSHYVAEPPTGRVSDALVDAYGPPWIPLADLGTGFSGELFTFRGHHRTEGSYTVGTWALAPQPAAITPVPEPATMTLFGIGLAAAAWRRKCR